MSSLAPPLQSYSAVVWMNRGKVNERMYGDDFTEVKVADCAYEGKEALKFMV